MAYNVSLFPLYSGSNIDLSYQYQISYDRAQVAHPLKLVDGTDAIKDDDDLWNPENFNLKISRDFRIENGCELFGSSGIVCSGAELGLAVAWQSSTSSQKGVTKVGIIRNMQQPQLLKYSIEFPKGTLRGKVTFKAFLYIDKQGIPEYNEIMLANIKGYCVGNLDEFSILLDGDGSMFPIYFVNAGGAPLWELHDSCNVPASDDFVDNVQIYINKDHKDAAYLDCNNPLFSKALLKEVVASALGLLIEHVRSLDPDFDCLDTYNYGSVAHAIDFYKKRLELSLESASAFSTSIRMLFDKNSKMS